MSTPKPPRDSKHLLARDERLADYRSGRMSPEETREFEGEVLADPALADALYADTNLIVAIDEAAAGSNRKIVQMPRGWLRRSAWIAAPLAAAALALLVLWPAERERPPAPDDPAFRSTDAASRIVAPVGDLDEAPSRFVWTRDAGAAMYRVELYDETGHLRHRSTTTDTTLVLPEDALPDGEFRSGYWKVIPMNDAGVERPGPTPASIRTLAP